MRKYLSVICGVLLVGILAISFTSCSKETTITPDRKNKELRFNVTVKDATDTKVVKTAWENGDKIFVFFNVTTPATGHLDAMKYVTLTYNGTTWDGVESASLTDPNELGTAGTMYGIFFPFGEVDIQSDAGGVKFRTQHTNPALDNLPIYTYYMSGNTPYTITTEGDIATLNGTFNLTIPDNYVFFFINKSGDDYNTDYKYRLAVDGIYPVACTSFKNGTFSETPSSIPANPMGTDGGQWDGQPIWGYKYGGAGISFTGKMDNSWKTDADRTFILFCDGDPAQKRVIGGKSLSSHKSIRLNMTSGWSQALSTPPTTQLINGTTTLVVADWNLGATDVDGKGYYFMWGGLIEPRECNAAGMLTERLIGNNNLVGNYKIYDAARAWLGADWRMPTYDELTWLMGGTKTWITDGNPSDVKVGTDSKILTPSVLGLKTQRGNSIFLPATGMYDGPGKNYKDSSYGRYWSSTQNSPNPYRLQFNVAMSHYDISTASYREWAMPIRPIYIQRWSDPDDYPDGGDPLNF